MLPITHDMKYNVKTVSSKVQVLPLLHECHNVALALLYKSSLKASEQFEFETLEVNK